MNNLPAASCAIALAQTLSERSNWPRPTRASQPASSSWAANISKLCVSPTEKAKQSKTDRSWARTKRESDLSKAFNEFQLDPARQFGFGSIIIVITFEAARGLRWPAT